jgi:hypothetical protein
MSDLTTRRGFLQKTAAAGSGLILLAAGDTVTVHEGPGNTGNAPILLVTQPVSPDVNPRARTWSYASEILRRAGLFFDQLPPGRLSSVLRDSNRIVLLAGHLPLTAEQRGVLAAWVKNGGALIGLGGTSGLDEVFGVSGGRPLAEGWMKVAGPEHPVTAGLRSSLHVFGGYAARPGSARSLAEMESGPQGPKGSAILENRCGRGRAVLLAPDLLFSIVHIQQGVPVLQDGKPAPDGSAPTNDGVLKSEDGMVLDWQRDRTPLPPEGMPAFLEPISDELREIILRSIFHVAREQGLPLPVLWYWPRSLRAVAHLSHDTDGNEPPKAVALLEVVTRCRVKSTWCTLYPGGYPREFYTTLKDQGFEIGLHYDAMSGGAATSWSKGDFLLQHRWLLKEAELSHLASNKNHYLRWEGRLDFLRWCEEAGLHCDQTRGPSKKGTIGFPLGGSQPYFPLDDETETPRFLDVLEVNLLTQDLVVTCPSEYGRQLVDSVLRHHGVAHFLFHPAHILKPGVADALGGVVDYARAQGLEWWTSEQIYQWEILRRGTRAKFDSPNAFTLRAARPLHEATLLVLKSRPEPWSIRLNDQPAQTHQWDWHGFEFEAVTTDLTGAVTVRVA